MKKILPTPASGKREYKRYVIHDTRIRLYTDSVFKFLKKEIPKPLLVNISQDGFQTVSRRSVVIDNTYQAIMVIPKIGEFLAKAKAVWCRSFIRETYGRYYRSGFMFTHLSEDVWRKLCAMDHDIQTACPDPTRHWGYIPDESVGIVI